MYEDRGWWAATLLADRTEGNSQGVNNVFCMAVPILAWDSKPWLSSTFAILPLRGKNRRPISLARSPVKVESWCHHHQVERVCECVTPGLPSHDCVLLVKLGNRRYL